MRSQTMDLLDEDIAAVKLSKSNGHGGINEDVSYVFTDQQTLDFFRKAITTATKDSNDVVNDPEYDVMVEYEPNKDGQLPTHGLHLILGETGSASKLMYVTNTDVYVTTKNVTKKLRQLILNESQ
ncbi:hypothetical protein [Lentibacillus saliphilus]|uniref:hypothetical protein n=1 Tax=Lentibacillus saliphilus TaxID=2737028 RepID=UPI001C2FBDF9|nr:hypothetical protein [Lentibacillus saliphilus]